ncbi:DivIVA domain-containing protein [Calidifontibacter terrae]
MIAVLIVLLVVVAGVAVAAVMGRFSGHLDDAVHTTPFEPLPAGPVTADDVAALRFDQTVRGYRMGQVDDVLDRLRAELLERDAEIARLRGASTPSEL